MAKMNINDDKETKSIEIRFEDGTKEEINKGCVMSMENNENSDVLKFGIKFVNTSGKELITLMLGMFGLIEQSGYLEDIIKIYYKEN